MASRRLLKKQIHNIISELLDECIVCNLLIPNFDNTKLDTFVEKLISIDYEFVQRINNQEKANDKKRVKHYYDVLISDFNKQTLEIIKELNKEDIK